MTTEELAVRIQSLIDDGWIPCGTCEGLAYSNFVPGRGPHACDDCDSCGFVHPFLSMEEYEAQVAERGGAS